MEDSSEDLPKPPRRTAARPFFSPRPSSGEGVTGPLELSRRRAAQLFTPPGSSPATPLVDRTSTEDVNSAATSASTAASNAADGATGVDADSSHADAPLADASPNATDDIEFEGDWTAPPMIMPERTLDADSLLSADGDADDDRLVVEQFEHEDIELTASASNVADEHSIEVIAYDDANSLLKAAASDGRNPQVDGLQLESTEFSFEQESPPPHMNVDSFWASEPFAKIEDPADGISHRADETEATIDEETAGEPALEAEPFAATPSIEDQPLEWADDPSTTISHAQAALEPEPEHDPESRVEATRMLADISPPWMSRLTPVSTKALEELKESEPWDLTPSHGLELIPEYPHTSAPAVDIQPAAEAPNSVADALVRIAARVRDGELEVRAESEMSDEAALSAVLTALLRIRR